MPPKLPPRYHHGDLRPTLLREAQAMVREVGLDGLSLRQLGQRVGVSASALYHHFDNKNALLCALAEEGFTSLDRVLKDATQDASGSARDQTLRFVRAYVGYAAAHPEVYDLMFGRSIWKAGEPTESLRSLAFETFRRYVDYVTAMDPAVGRGKAGLRRAQARWACVHGLCRLVIDGVYADGADLAGMTAATADLLVGADG